MVKVRLKTLAMTVPAMYPFYTTASTSGVLGGSAQSIQYFTTQQAESACSTPLMSARQEKYHLSPMPSPPTRLGTCSIGSQSWACWTRLSSPMASRRARRACWRSR